jgi:4-diphosphocytidyl-2-C-methyl-D-erythritol kinase
MVNTALAYKKFDEDKGEILHPKTAKIMEFLDFNENNFVTRSQFLREIAKKCGNVLEPVVAKNFSEINICKKIMFNAGAKITQMSGSGSCVFGIFEDNEACELAAKKLTSKNFICFLCETISREN